MSNFDSFRKTCVEVMLLCVSTIMLYGAISGPDRKMLYWKWIFCQKTKTYGTRDHVTNVSVLVVYVHA